MKKKCLFLLLWAIAIFILFHFGAVGLCVLSGSFRKLYFESFAGKSTILSVAKLGEKLIGENGYHVLSYCYVAARARFEADDQDPIELDQRDLELFDLSFKSFLTLEDRSDPKAVERNQQRHFAILMRWRNVDTGPYLIHAKKPLNH